MTENSLFFKKFNILRGFLGCLALGLIFTLIPWNIKAGETFATKPMTQTHSHSHCPPPLMCQDEDSGIFPGTGKACRLYGDQFDPLGLFQFPDQGKPFQSLRCDLGHPGLEKMESDTSYALGKLNEA